MATLELQTAHLPLAYGLESKIDPRALKAPLLAQARNVQFDESGGLQTRLPYANMPTGIVGGGSIANPRRLATYGDELLLFTSTALYAWSEKDQLWTLRSTYLAPEVTEQSVFARTNEQLFGERAELSGVVVLVWEEAVSTTVAHGYIAATDAVTGAVLVAPTAVHTATSAVRIKATACNTRIVVTWMLGSNPHAFTINPASVAADIASGIASPTTYGTGTGPLGARRHDICHDPVADFLYIASDRTTAYALLRINPVTLASTNAVPARTVTGPISVSVDGSGIRLCVARFDGTNMRADFITAATLGDSSVNVNIGTPTGSDVFQIASAWTSIARAVIFWDSDEDEDSTSGDFTTEMNTADPIGSAGTKSIIVRRLAIASRAFIYNSQVYVWLVFAGRSDASGMGLPLGLRSQLQNVYLLYQENATDYAAEPIAKAIPDRSGGFSVAHPGAGSYGHLPNVQNTASGVYQTALIERRVIPLGARQSEYSGKTPKVVRLQFDANTARRSARLGRTLYVTGGQVQQYDGVGLVELGFHVAPWAWVTAALAGSLAAGTYNHQSSYSWVNAQQERERSTIVIASATAIAASNLVTFSGSVTPFLYATKKKGARAAVSVEYWRTPVNPMAEAQYQLVTSVDPTQTTNPNRYIANDVTDDFVPGFDDDLVDASLRKRESFPENGNILQSLVAPASKILVATQDRLIAAGVAHAPHQIVYSKLRGVDELAAFNGLLSADLPPDGGDITAVIFMGETMVVFKESAIYALPGDGFDNAGGGQNYGPARVLASDIGAESQEAVALTPRGILFKSQKGWYLLNSWAPPNYTGGPVAAFDDEPVQAMTLVETQHQVRILTSSRMLVWDYEANPNRDAVTGRWVATGGSWAEWPVGAGSGAALWRGRHAVIADGAVKLQATTFSGATELGGIDVETGWINMADLQGQQRIWFLVVLLEWRSAFRLRVRLKRDYDESTYFDDKYWTPTNAVLGAPNQVRHSPSIQQCEAMKIRLTANDLSVDNQLAAGESLKLTGLSIEYGVRPGVFRRLAPGQLQ